MTKISWLILVLLFVLVLLIKKCENENGAHTDQPVAAVIDDSNTITINSRSGNAIR